MRSRLILAGLCGGYFLVLLDVTVIAVALPSIADELGEAGLPWVVDAYTLPLALLLLPAGLIGDRLGHKTVLLAGVVAFAAGSALCAAAPAMSMLVAGRCAQGVGAALLLPGSLTLVTELFPRPGERARAIGVWSAVGGLALPAGPLAGGVLTAAFGWRAAFWVALPILIAMAAAVVASPEVPRRAVPVGGLLRAPRRLYLAATVGAAMNLCTVGMLFVLSQWLQVHASRSPVQAGLALLPAFVPMPILGPVAGRLVARRGSWATATAGLLLGAAGFSVLAAIGGGPSWPASGGMLLWGIGIALLTPAIVTAAMEQLPSAPGLASGLSNAARQAGTTAGVGIFAAIAGPASSPEFGHGVAIAAGTASVVFVLLAAIATRTRSQPLLTE